MFFSQFLTDMHKHYVLHWRFFYAFLIHLKPSEPEVKDSIQNI
jgi:hypothetical protein